MVPSILEWPASTRFGAAMGLFQALKDSHFWQRPIPKSN
jgi:hypothetical protein